MKTSKWKAVPGNVCPHFQRIIKDDQGEWRLWAFRMSGREDAQWKSTVSYYLKEPNNRHRLMSEINVGKSANEEYAKRAAVLKYEEMLAKAAS